MLWLIYKEKIKKQSKLRGRGKLGKERTTVPASGFHHLLKDKSYELYCCLFFYPKQF